MSSPKHLSARRFRSVYNVSGMVIAIVTLEWNWAGFGVRHQQKNDRINAMKMAASELISISIEWDHIMGTT